MRDHHQVGDVARGDEGVQLAGQAAGGAARPHVLREVAVDDQVVGRVGQALSHRIDHRPRPVVVEGVGLTAGAVDEGDAGVGVAHA